MNTYLSISLETILRIGFFILLALFLFHALILSYHWFSYGAKKRTGLIALGVYICGGLLLFTTLGANIAYII